MKYFKLSRARRRVAIVKKKFGYTPNILKVTNPRTNKKFYVVVKGKGIKVVR